MLDEFLDYVRCCFRKSQLPKWWGKVVNLVTLVLGWAFAGLIFNNPNWTSTYQARVGLLLIVVVPCAAATIAVVGRIAISPFLVSRDATAEHRREVQAVTRERDDAKLLLKSLLDRSEQERNEKRERMLQTCALMLKEQEIDMMPFHAMFRVGASKFESNDDVINLCDNLVAAGFDHPFTGLDEWVLKEEWLSYIKWGYLHPTIDFAIGGDYLSAATEWVKKQGRVEPDRTGVWRGVMALALDENKGS